LGAAARGIKGVIGFMYTTWAHQFSLLDAYANAIRE
jgi:hypothetical protein